MDFKLEVEKKITKQVPPKRSQFGLCKLNNNTIAIYGGYMMKSKHYTYYDDFWMITGFKNNKYKWIEIKNTLQWPPALRGNTLNYYNKNIYLYGGIRQNMEINDDLWIFNIKSSVWRQLETPSNISGFCGHKSVVYEHYIIYFGRKNHKQTSLLIFNCNDNTWKDCNVGDKPASNFGQGMCIMDNILMIHGGNDGLRLSKDMNNVYTLNMDDVLSNNKPKWIKVKSDLPSISNHLCLCDENRIYVFGSYYPPDISGCNGELCVFSAGYLLVNNFIDKYAVIHSKLLIPSAVINEIRRYMGLNTDVFVANSVQHINITPQIMNRMENHNGCVIYIKKQPHIFIFGGSSTYTHISYNDSYLVTSKQLLYKK